MKITTQQTGNKVKLSKNESSMWIFELVRNHQNGSFTVYANGVKSFTTKDAEDSPGAMKEYFEKWDTDEVTLP